MSDVKVNALVIKSADYQDSDKLLTLMTLERGRITAKIKGCKTPKSKLRNAASPLSFGEYLLNVTRGRYLVIGCDIKDNFKGISEDVDKYYTSSIILEMAYKLTEENMECLNLMLVLLKNLNELCYGDISPPILAIKAMLDIMKEAGYSLKFNNCRVCGKRAEYISYEEGGSVCKEHKGYQYGRLSQEAAELLTIISADQGNLINVRFKPAEIKEILIVLNAFINYQCGIKLNSINQYCSII